MLFNRAGRELIPVIFLNKYVKLDIDVFVAYFELDIMLKYILLMLCFASPLYGEVSNVYLGAPGQSTKYHNGYPIVREQYSMLYDTVFNQPLWVTWQLNKSSYGKYGLWKVYLTDSTLPKSFYKVSYLTDYYKSDYVPYFHVDDSERSTSEAECRNTALLSQAMPLWLATADGICRTITDSCKIACVDNNKQIFVYSGPIFKATPSYISTQKSQNKVAIPDSCYKIIAELDSLIPLDKITPANIKIKAYVFVNSPFGNTLPFYNLTNVDHIEALTGLDFFSNLPTEVQSAIESPATGIIEEEDNELKIYPSPTAGTINIDGDIHTPIEVYDINGQFRLCDNKSKIDLSDLPAGGYYLRANNKMYLFIKI